MGKIRQTFPKEVKLRAIQLYEEEGMTYRSIAKELGLKCHKIVQRWVKHYQNEGISGLDEKRGKSAGLRTGRPRKRPLTLEEENKRLRAENEYLKKWLGLERR
jgi:transposase